MFWIVSIAVVLLVVFLLLWKPSGPKYELKCEIAELRKRYMLFYMMCGDVIRGGQKEMADGILKDMEKINNELRVKEEQLKNLKNQK